MSTERRNPTNTENNWCAAYRTRFDLFEKSSHGRMLEGEFSNKKGIHEDTSGPDVRGLTSIRTMINNLWGWFCREHKVMSITDAIC